MIDNVMIHCDLFPDMNGFSKKQEIFINNHRANKKLWNIHWRDALILSGAMISVFETSGNLSTLSFHLESQLLAFQTST